MLMYTFKGKQLHRSAKRATTASSAVVGAAKVEPAPVTADSVDEGAPVGVDVDEPEPEPAVVVAPPLPELSPELELSPPDELSPGIWFESATDWAADW